MVIDVPFMVMVIFIPDMEIPPDQPCEPPPPP
jgi:hypothetical protein